MELPDAVRELRVATGDTQQSLAQRLGLSIRAITNYEKDRAPNSTALFRFGKLAKEIGRSDLAQVFNAALATDLQDTIEPMSEEEKAWSDAVLVLLRNRELGDWPTLGRTIVRALETLLSRKGHQDAEKLAEILLEARYRLANEAERRLKSLTQARQAKTGETYYQAYAEVLLKNPDLYQQYLQERAAAARGTAFETTMALPKPRKRGKSK